jgi:hypothetical protein
LVAQAAASSYVGAAATTIGVWPSGWRDVVIRGRQRGRSVALALLDLGRLAGCVALVVGIQLLTAAIGGSVWSASRAPETPP